MELIYGIKIVDRITNISAVKIKKELPLSPEYIVNVISTYKTNNYMTVYYYVNNKWIKS
jgi:hypothetical protein